MTNTTPHSSTPLRAIVYDSFEKQWLSFQEPTAFFVCNDFSSVKKVLKTVEKQSKAGLYAVGFISYDAAPAFDPALSAKSNSDFPLAVFATYDKATPVSVDKIPTIDFRLDKNTRSITKAKFESDLDKIKKYIELGDTYQVNYTHRLNFEFTGDALSFFLSLIRNVNPAYAAFIEWEDYAICSVSPELFFWVDGHRIMSKPMKGTRPRGRFWQEDQKLKDELYNSEKDRAENVMIVDMIRNDLGRIAEIGSVSVDYLYDIEKYPTVWQMTSTVSARTNADLLSIMYALFPCASITGAPKVRTMQIIDELETTPRKMYTGTIGLIKPNRHMQFNVSIRTAVIDKKNKSAQYGVGSGIVWDSETENEWEECQVKSRVLQKEWPKFELLETMLYEPESGLFLLEYHLERMLHSADYFDFPFDEQAARAIITNIHFQDQRQKLRLLLDKNGEFKLEHYPQNHVSDETPVRLKIASKPVDSNNVFLFHKTTYRTIYNMAREQHPNADDVILYNEDGQVTETCINNLLIKRAGHLFTSPIQCGLLGGTYRRWLLDRGEVTEKVLTVDDLKSCDTIYVVNSVQGKRKAVLLDV